MHYLNTIGSLVTKYVPDYLNEIVEQLVLLWELDTSTFVYESGKRKSKEQRHYEHLYECEDCSGCPYAEKCKKTDKNRTVRINQELTSMHQEVIENLESIHGALLRMNRSIQAEGTFGIMKNDRWYKRIVRRGIHSVKLEVLLVAIDHNLHKYQKKKMRNRTAA